MHGEGYPYPFINVTKLGEMQAGINAIGISDGFTICGFVLVFIDLLLLGRRRSNR